MLSQTVICIQASTVLQVLDSTICTGLTRITVHSYPAKNRPEHAVIHSTFPTVVQCKHGVEILT